MGICTFTSSSYYCTYHYISWFTDAAISSIWNYRQLLFSEKHLIRLQETGTFITWRDRHLHHLKRQAPSSPANSSNFDEDNGELPASGFVAPWEVLMRLGDIPIEQATQVSSHQQSEDFGIQLLEQENSDSSKPHSQTSRPYKRTKCLHDPSAGLTFPNGLLFDLGYLSEFWFWCCSVYTVSLNFGGWQCFAGCWGNNHWTVTCLDLWSEPGWNFLAKRDEWFMRVWWLQAVRAHIRKIQVWLKSP